MVRNVGNIDSILRAVAGLGLLVAAAAVSPAWIASGALVVVALVLLVTALTERCPAYRLFGWTTRREAPPPTTPEPHARA